MKRILLAVLIIGVVAAIAVGGTVAYFQTTSSVNGEVSTATLVLTTDPADGSSLFQIGNLVPGEPAVTKTVMISNAGDVGMLVKPSIQLTGGSGDLAAALNCTVNFGGEETYTGTLAGAANYAFAAIPVKDGDGRSLVITVELPETGVVQELQGQTVDFKVNVKGASVNAPASF